MILWKILATFQFEFRRSLTTSRIATSSILALFAPVMLFLIGNAMRIDEFSRQIPLPIVVLGVFHLLAVFLSVLLWATPVVYSELEGKTWVYLAIRPHGKLASTLGKYLNAVFWAIMTAGVSLTLSCVVVSQFPWDPDMLVRELRGSTELRNTWREMLGHASEPWVIWYSLMPSIVLGSLALSAIFVHIGLIFHRRAMVLAVVYAVVESVFAFLPAMIRQLSVGFHMRNIGFKIAGFEFPQVDEGVITDGNSMLIHVLILLIIVGIHLLASIGWLHSREYIRAEEN